MAIQDIRDSLVIRERDLFLLTDPAGQVPRGNSNGYGLYYADTRYLSGYEFSFSTSKAMVLLANAELGYSSEHVLTNYAMDDLQGRRLPHGTIEVHRTRVLAEALEETLEVANYNDFAVDLELVFRFAADFADIFIVRGYEPESQGHLEPPVCEKAALRLTYHGSDGQTRQTQVAFAPQPSSIQADQEAAFVTFRVALQPRQSELVELMVMLDGRLEPRHGLARFAQVAAEYDAWRQSATRLEADNDFFDAVLARSLADIRMLWNDGPGGGYPAAGTPWFDTLFGRDSAIVGMQTLWLKPDIARDCLAALARWQGKKFDPWRDEEPGKILHELRLGEMTQTGQLPFSPYYGSVDSTPLFLLLAGEYYRWTADIELLRLFETNLRAGLHWLQEYGHVGAGGYLEYEKRSSRGLVNQGWKDSTDSICHADGTLVRPPVKLAEVQAYVYAALLGLGPVFSALGDAAEAERLRAQAAELREWFDRDFWLEEGFYAMALDGEGRPAASLASNAGQVLWSGISTPARAASVVQRLVSPQMFSGWGIRTLASDSPRYNPQGYHVGSVWPHDNSLILMGLKRYGCEAELNLVATALFQAAKVFPYYRLPELFGGNARSGHHSPVPYPVACRPQAWAAGAFPLIAQAMLGLCPDAPNGVLHIVRPVLPEWLDHARIEGLRVGGAEVDLYYERFGERTAVDVLDVRGALEVAVREDWPSSAP